MSTATSENLTARGAGLLDELMTAQTLFTTSATEAHRIGVYANILLQCLDEKLRRNSDVVDLCVALGVATDRLVTTN